MPYSQILLTLACLFTCSINLKAEPSLLRNVVKRDAFTNSRIKFEREGQGHVAFIGGSITEMNGYRPMVENYLKKRFPKTKFKFTAAGISSTCSTTGAFRLEDHVLKKGPVDLFFVEFAVNDDQDAAHKERECLRGLEGIIRHTRKHNPFADIIYTHFINPPMLKLIQEGTEPTSMKAHEKVAKAYKISTIRLAHEVAQRIKEKTLTWKKFGGTHPAPAGNRVCADMIEALLEACWSKNLPASLNLKKHLLPKPIDKNSYSNGRFISLSKATNLEGFKVEVPKWKKLPGNCRTRFKNEKMITADQAGNRLTLEFSGTAVGIYLLAGPDAGKVEVSIDGNKSKEIDLYHRYSRGLHYPRSIIIDADLSEGPHKLTLTVSPNKNKQSKGHAVRILKFLAN